MMDVKHLYNLFLIGFLLLACDVYAERRAFNNEVVNEEAQAPIKKKIPTPTLYAYRTNGDTAHVDIPTHKSMLFFNGVFFKRVNERTLNLPSANLQDRYFECDHCNILDYSVVKQLSSTCVNAFELEVPEKIRRCNMTATSKKGDTLMVATIEVYPKADLFMKINNDTLVKVDSTTNISSLITGKDDCAIVINSEESTLKVNSHYLKSPNSMGGTLVEKNPGSRLTPKERNILANLRSPLILVVEFVEMDGTWEKSFDIIR